jgi:thiol:disulfide interchange protein DsbD
MPLLRPVWALFVLLACLLCGTAARADEFLDPDQAFQLSVRPLADKRVELSYKIAPGYYLYRDRFKFSSPDATLGEPQIPAGTKHYDTALEQTVEVYHDRVVVTLPVQSAPKAFTIAATHQGCAEKGLCYPPQPRTLNVALKAFGADADSATVAPFGDGTAAPVAAPAAVEMSVAPGASTSAGALRNSVLGGSAPAPAAAPLADRTPPTSATDSAPLGDDRRMTEALAGGHLLAIVSLAFVLGLGLALTPCVWPMLPILSSIIVGQGRDVTPARGFALAATYSLGMALVYTLLGVVAGKIGEGFTGYLQSPVVLVSFGVLLVVLSLSMFGFYELQLPAALRDRLNAKNESLSGGQIGGVFGMGVLSALIVSPCVSAPLVGVLIYIGQSHDAVLGGVALFTIAAGMSVPLLVIGASAGKALPRSGAWMEQVKRAFGLVLLGVALYIVQPVIPALAAMLAWGVLAIVSAASLGAFEPIATKSYVGTARTVKGLGLVLAVFGAIEFVGAASGGRDPAQPLAHLAQARGGAVLSGEPHFDRIASVAELDQRLQAAGKPVMLDFYADWCVSCKEMETQTFVDPGVKAKLANAVLLRADVTANSADDRALLKRFGLFGPPGIIFFDAQGREVGRTRVVGYQDAPRFLQSLASAGL